MGVVDLGDIGHRDVPQGCWGRRHHLPGAHAGDVLHADIGQL